MHPRHHDTHDTHRALRTPRALIAGLLFMLLAVQSLRAQTPDLRRIEAVADSLAHAYLGANEAPGLSIAVAYDGALVVAKGYGEADVEQGAAAGPETVYRIASITKQFTAAAVMQLVEQGRIALDDPITRFLPDYPTQGHTVTVRHLLNHTSGIKSITGIDRSWMDHEFRLDLTDEELIALFANEPYDFAPGEGYRYNNSGYLLLGMILEAVTETPYPDYMAQALFEPLGLDATRYCGARGIIPNRAGAYAYQDGALVHDRYISMRIPGAAGALCSTVGDLVRWTQLLHDGQVVTPASLEQMTDSTVLADGDKQNYGFGLTVGEALGRPVVQHGGGIPGGSARLAHYPDDRLTIAVLTNASDGEPGDLAQTLARSAFGMMPRDLPLTAADMARYEGAYALDIDGRTHALWVYPKDGRLVGEVDGELARPLLYQSDHAFVYAHNPDIRFTFAVAGDRATGLTLRNAFGAYAGPRNAELERAGPPSAVEPLPAAELRRYEGPYVLQLGDETRDLRIYVEEGQLMADLEGEGTSGLLYRGDHTFIAAIDSDFRFVFAASDGPAASVTLNLGDRKIPGTRKP